MSLSDFPTCAYWKHVVADVKVPACPIKVSMPCIGVYGSKTCFSNVGAVCEPVNIFDLEDGYTDLLQHMTDGAELNLGEQKGDVLNIDLANLEDSHILLSGPPCPPWAGNGNKKSTGDTISQVFHKVLQMIIYLAQRGLLAFIIENVSGILAAWSGREPYIHTIRDALIELLPDWDITIEIVKAAECLLPQERNRVLLVGMRKIVAKHIPTQILCSWGNAVSLESILNPNLPIFNRAQLTGQKGWNLVEWEMKLKVMQRLGKLTNEVRIAVFALDRDPNKSWVSSISFDKLPTLTCANSFLFMLKVSELYIEDGFKTLFRFLHPLERFAAQGLDPGAAGTYLPDRILVKAAGNAYPPNILAPFLCPIIHAIAEWGGLDAWPNSQEQVQPVIAAKKASLFKHMIPPKIKKSMKSKKIKKSMKTSRRVKPT